MKISDICYMSPHVMPPYALRMLCFQGSTDQCDVVRLVHQSPCHSRGLFTAPFQGLGFKARLQDELLAAGDGIRIQTQAL